MNIHYKIEKNGDMNDIGEIETALEDGNIIDIFENIFYLAIDEKNPVEVSLTIKKGKSIVNLDILPNNKME